MMFGSVGVGLGTGMADGCGGSDMTGSGCTVCSVLTIVVVAGYAWDVGSGLGSGFTSSLMLGIDAVSDSAGRGASSRVTSAIVGVSSEVGSGTGVVV